MHKSGVLLHNEGSGITARWEQRGCLAGLGCYVTRRKKLYWWWVEHEVACEEENRNLTALEDKGTLELLDSYLLFVS